MTILLLDGGSLRNDSAPKVHDSSVDSRNGTPEGPQHSFDRVSRLPV